MQVPRAGLEQKLQKLSSSQASIESVSAFCIFYSKDARGVVQVWEEQFYKAPSERKLSLLYLANHVLQEGRRKGTGFQDEFFKVLPKAVSHMVKSGEEKSKRAVTRLVGVWEERRVFGSKHIKSFREVLPQAAGQAKASSSAAPASGSRSGLRVQGPAGEALAACQEAVSTTTAKEQDFNSAWSPALLASGNLAEVTTASSRLGALLAALEAERAARLAAVAALQAELAAQAAAVAGLPQRVSTCQQQQQQLESRMGLLTAQMAEAVAGLAGLPGLMTQQATNGSGGAGPGGASGGFLAAAPGGEAAAGEAEPGDSPQAPGLEDDEEEDQQQQQQLGAAAGTSSAPGVAGGGADAIFKALAALPDDARSKMNTDVQQLLATGLLANTGNAVAGTGEGAWPGAQQLPPWMGGVAPQGMVGLAGAEQQAPQEEEEEPYDPENPF